METPTPHNPGQIRTAACLGLLTTALVGCGGGTAPASAPPSVPAAPTGAYAAAAHRPSPGMFALNLFDPASPLPLALSLDFGNVSPSFQRASAARIDSAKGSYTELPSPWIVYARSGRLFQIDMALGKAPSPAPVADLTDVCQIESLFGLEATGRTGVAVVTTAGADASCTNEGDNRKALVRFGDTPSTVATRLPAEILGVMTDITDAEGRLLWLLMLENVPRPDFQGGPTTQLVGYKPTMERVPIPGSFAPGSYVWPSSGPLASGVWGKGRGPTGTWQLIFLTGSADSLALTQSLPGVASGAGVHTGPMVDNGAAYEVNYALTGLIRVQSTGSVQNLGTLNRVAGSVDELLQNAAYLLVSQRAFDGKNTWTSVDKRDGSSRTLLGASPLAAAELVALGDTRLVYRTQLNSGNGELRAVDLASGVDSLLESNMVHPRIGAVSLVSASTGSTLVSSPFFATAVLVCRPQAANGDCRDSDLVQVNISAGEQLILGRFPASSSPARITMSGFAVMGQATSTLTLNAITTVLASRVTDSYSFEPGRAGSLKRVTNAIP